MEGIKAQEKKKGCLKKKDDVTNGEKRKDRGLLRKRACVCIMCVM